MRSITRRVPWLIAIAVLVAGIAGAPYFLASRPTGIDDFLHFESGHVRPAAMTPDGTRLLVVNTPDGQLAVFDLTGGSPQRVAEIPVGLEPVAVAARTNDEAWVVNTLSDDISIVDLQTLHVKRTLRVGDEPADVVFAGSPEQAFVSVSQLDQVRVYDPVTLARTATIPIPGRMPRALARSADGTGVFAAVFHAGNRTSLVSFTEALDSLPPPNPPMAGGLPVAPHVALIIQQQGANWVDETGKLWNSKTPYTVLDTDVAEIDVASTTVSRTFGGIGTVNFGIAVSPLDGRLAVTGTEARNLVRFEPNLAGHNVDTRIGWVTTAGLVMTRNLNPDVNYAVTPGPPAERDSALGIPTGVAFSPDGLRAYVTSLGSDRLGVVDPSGGTDAVVARVPTVAGPTGVVVDAARGRLYVVGRFRNQLQTFAAATLAPLAVAAIGFDPTPDPIVNGRKFFYGGFTSGHGEHACASCHVFGDFDNIAWDLGDPQGVYAAPPPPQNQNPTLEGFHPMKGPMVTQSLRGLPGTGVLHWRGDRLDLAAFNPAFVGLLGRSTPLPDSEMTAFSDFVMPLVYPPNPNRLLDRTPPDAPAGQPSALRGETFFFGTPVDGGQTCNFCHTGTDFRAGTNGIIFPDDVLLDDQDIKVPQLRNLYKKTGFRDQPGAVNTRGFGFTHDGGFDNLFRFLQVPVFNFGGNPTVANNNRRDVEAFLHAFDTGVAPAVGFEITFHGANNDDAFLAAQVDTLKQQRQLNYCDLIAKGRVAGVPRGWEYVGADLWRPDVAGEPDIPTATLIALAGAGSEVTIRGVPNGAGTRMGIDRDRDGYRDGEERAAGSDPGNPLSTPDNVGVGPGADMRFAFRAIAPNPSRAGAELRFTLGARTRVTAIAYDVMGREVRRIADGVWLEAGPQSLHWDGRLGDGTRAPAGLYFVRLATERGDHATRTLVRMN